MLNKITLFKAFTQGSDSCSKDAVNLKLTLLSIRYHILFPASQQSLGWLQESQNRTT